MASGNIPKGVKYFHRRVRAAREALGLTQTQLGERIGKGQSAISTWETEGAKRPDDLDDLGRLATVLHVSLDWLVCGETVAHGEPAAAAKELDPEQEARIEAERKKARGAIRKATEALERERQQAKPKRRLKSG